MSTQVSRRLFTTKEYHQMLEAGILSEDDRVELIAREIVEMAPIGSRHAACVDRLNRLFSLYSEERAIVRVQSPIHVSEHSEPQPDVALLRPCADFYTHAHPQPQDILLVVEVAEPSVEYDRIVEAWLVDLSTEHVEAYRNPSPQGYREIRRLERGQLLQLQTFQELELAVDEVLG